MANLSKQAKEIINEREYITIASVSEDGQPWNTPVYSAFDENFTFYWGSHKDAQHSQNIEHNEKVFIVIYDSTVPAGEGEGVYVQAVATQLTSETEKDKAHKLIQGRRPNWYWRRHEFDGETPLALYKAVPRNVWMNGGDKRDGHYIDTREEVEIYPQEDFKLQV